MTALRLALTAQRHGVCFKYRGDRIVALHLNRLPPGLRTAFETRLADVLAVVAEQSTPPDVRPSDVIDAARRIALGVRSASNA